MKRMIALCLALFMLLTGCAGQPAAQEDGLRLWYTTDMAEWTASTTALATCGYRGRETVPALMSALLEGPPDGTKLVSPIPAGTTLVAWSLENGVLTLALSRSYSDLVGVDLTLADYCITLTMSQISGVKGVRIVVSNGPPSWRERGILRADDVVLSGAEEEPVELSAALYFRRTGGNQLGYELRVFQLTEDELPTEAVLEALVAGPEDDGLSVLIPDGVSIYSARVDDAVCYVDFSAALLKTVPLDEETQNLILSSVVETLCGLRTVEAVQILVEGEPAQFYGSVNISQPLEPAGGRP